MQTKDQLTKLENLNANKYIKYLMLLDILMAQRKLSTD